MSDDGSAEASGVTWSWVSGSDKFGTPTSFKFGTGTMDGIDEGDGHGTGYPTQKNTLFDPSLLASLTEDNCNLRPVAARWKPHFGRNHHARCRGEPVSRIRT